MHVFMTYIWYNMLVAKANRQLACIVWRLDLGKLSGLTQGGKNTERKREEKWVTAVVETEGKVWGVEIEPKKDQFHLVLLTQLHQT